MPTNARILSAYAVSPSGTHQEASSIRGGSIRFRGLEVGSRVVVQYVHHDPPPAFLPNHFVSELAVPGHPPPAGGGGAGSFRCRAGASSRCTCRARCATP
ncbi:MAG: hypothetical protein M5U28_45250 [Sandaracinaceae bacterium]|nr:hypothetical protein [Sandaracinaceae bacterium]